GRDPLPDEYRRPHQDPRVGHAQDAQPVDSTAPSRELARADAPTGLGPALESSEKRSSSLLPVSHPKTEASSAQNEKGPRRRPGPFSGRVAVASYGTAITSLTQKSKGTADLSFVTT